MDRTELKEFAKKRLKENRWPMVLVSLIATILSGASVACSRVTFDESGKVVPGNPVLGLLGCVLAVLIVNIITVGACKFFRDNVSVDEKADVILYPFKNNYAKNVGTMLVVSIFVSLGVILFVIPGFIVAVGLAPVPYLLTQKSELKAMDIIKLSWNLMKGHKWEYFVLILSFIGWFFLDVLTLGILGIFYVHPYVDQTKANYFDKLLADA